MCDQQIRNSYRSIIYFKQLVDKKSENIINHGHTHHNIFIVFYFLSPRKKNLFLDHSSKHFQKCSNETQL